MVSDSLRLHGLQHATLPCSSPTPRTCSNSCPSSQWYHPTISSSVVPFSSCLQSFPASGFFSRSQFSSGGQSILVSASASVLPMNIQDWFPLGWTDWLSLQSKGLSRVSYNTTIQKHQFFGFSSSFLISSKTQKLMIELSSIIKLGSFFGRNGTVFMEYMLILVSMFYDFGLQPHHLHELIAKGDYRHTSTVFTVSCNYIYYWGQKQPQCLMEKLMNPYRSNF